MIYAFAIEPEQVAEWAKDRRDYKDALRQFALGEPRVLAEYPRLKVWRREVLRTCSKERLDMARAEELVKKLGERLGRRDCDSWKGERPWLDNAEDEHARCPFHLILATENPRGNSDVVRGGALWDCDDPRWTLERGQPVGRSADSFVAHLAPLLSTCGEVIFVDPYFSPDTSRYRNTLKAFLRAIVETRNGPLPGRVEIHTSLETGATAGHFAEKCRSRLPNTVPRDMKVTIKRWKELPEGQSLHNRYILTDLGGISFGHGLDEGSAGDTDDAGILPPRIYEKRWRQYGLADGAFDLDEAPIEIVGMA